MRFTVRRGDSVRLRGPGSRTTIGAALAAWFLGTILIGAGGCGGGKAPKPEADTTSESKPKPAKGDETAPDAEEETADAKPSKSKASAKQAEIDGIPLDVVWFDDPLDVASDATAVGAPAGTAVAAATPKPSGGGMSGGSSAPPPPTPPAPAATGSGEWGELVTMDAVVNETKKIKNRLTDSLTNVGKYNGNYKEGIQMDGIVLATLAHIVPKLEGSLSWKGDAPVVRDLAAEVAKKANGLGQASYDPTRQAFEKLEGMLSGNKPAGLEDSPAELPFGEFAKRTALMKRMQKAYDFMKSNVTTESTFKKEIETVQQEASILAVLSRVCGAKEYPSADEDEYQQFIKDLVVACVEINAATKGEAFPAYQEAMNKMQRLCDNCHMAYRFE
jgi:cytochrome c556